MSDQQRIENARFRYRKDLFIYVMAHIAATGMTHLEIAQRLRMPLSVLRARLQEHRSWDLDFISDLLVAVNAAMDVQVIPMELR